MLRFTKLHGAGNDFILVETRDTERDWSCLARAMCDRHYGVGADGLLLLLPSTTADFGMREFNADGSESDACGNGLRCLGKYVMDTRLANTTKNEVLIETGAGTRKFISARTDDGAIKIQVTMGMPRFKAGEIPVKAGAEGEQVDIKLIIYPLAVADWELPLSFVSMGNPHAVYFWDGIVSDFPLAQVGPAVEHHQIFPERTNFEVARVTSRRCIEARVWERGVGETLACGSGACAIAVVAQLRDYVDNNVDIIYPGGTLEVEWDGKGEVLLGGPTETVFSGEWSDEIITAT
ncbi:diaminopimelate epimerase [Chloroflexota bacterium]